MTKSALTPNMLGRFLADATTKFPGATGWSVTLNGVSKTDTIDASELIYTNQTGVSFRVVITKAKTA